jgi:hypothetical protein
MTERNVKGIGSLAGVALLAAMALVGAAPASAAKPKTLYTQLKTLPPKHPNINSQAYEASRKSDDDQAAEDFVVPGRTSWKVTRVDIDAGYGSIGDSSAGPAKSLNVYFYKNAGGIPGKAVDVQKGLRYAVESKWAVAAKLDKPVHLSPGHYWVSVQGRQDSDTHGQFFWLYVTEPAKLPATFQNPGDGFGTGCTTWVPARPCVGDDDRVDLGFALEGTAKKHHRKRAVHRRVTRVRRAAATTAAAQAASSLSLSATAAVPPSSGSG